ncbi:MAG: hypothetical protein KatS3mg009_1626 [Acidimicrobiia bacterium]|nr:MAG: hypothetical protein KatS3mg009_1626 [Acidimicrobiia bacterium]
MVVAGGLVLAAWALALVVVEGDAPAPRTLSADEAAASGAPIVELGEMFVRGDLEVEAGRPVAVVNLASRPTTSRSRAGR